MPKHINMRKHLAGMLHGDHHNDPYGPWVIYREMDKTRRSTRWDDINKESREGPPWEYRDFVIRTWEYEQFITSTTERTRSQPLIEGNWDPNSHLYYVEHQLVCYTRMDTDNIGNQVTRTIRRWLDVKVGDIIYEIKQHQCFHRPPPKPYTVVSKQIIQDVIRMRGNGGRVEYYICLCKEDVPSP